MIFFPFEELTDRLKGQALNFVKKYEIISVQLSFSTACPLQKKRGQNRSRQNSLLLPGI